MDQSLDKVSPPKKPVASMNHYSLPVVHFCHYQMLTVVHFSHGRMPGAWRAHGGQRRQRRRRRGRRRERRGRRGLRRNENKYIVFWDRAASAVLDRWSRRTELCYRQQRNLRDRFMKHFASHPTGLYCAFTIPIGHASIAS